MRDDIQGEERKDETTPGPAARSPGEATRPARVAPATPASTEDDDGPASDESGGPTAPQRPPADS